jgi:succinoglycan biosynthesis transport protein ExoP
MDLNTSQEVHLSHYWNIIVKRWKVALSIVAVVMLGTFLASEFSKPLYRSVITIQIERENPNQLTIEDLFGIEGSDQEFLQTQYVLLKSRGLAQRVIDDQKLLSDPEFYPAGIVGKSKKEVEQIRNNMSGSVIGSLDVTPVRGTSLVEISYVAASPRLAAKVAEGVGTSYMHLNIEQKIDTVQQASSFLTQQIAQVKLDLENLREQLSKFGKQQNIVSINTATTLPAQKLLKLASDLTNARTETNNAQSAYETLIHSSPESVASDDGLVRSLSEQEANLQRDYNQKLANLKPEHPEMQRIKQTIDRTRQARQSALIGAFAKKREAAHNDVVGAQGRENEMSGAYESAKRELQDTNINTQTFEDLRKEVETKQILLEQLIKKQNETEVTARLRGSNTSNIHWVDHAEVPHSRFNLSMKHNLQSAFPLGIVLGLTAIFFLEYMDRSIKTSEELERVTHFASLGVIPAASSVGRGYGSRYGYGYGSGSRLRAVEDQQPKPAEASAGIDLLPHLDSRSPISEAYRAFRTSLLLASANSPKVIVITSTFAREGKTTTSVNLATVLAQMGKPVLLIDADLRRPRLQKVFKGKMNLGLVNYLAASIPLEDVIQETVVPHLSVVLSGPTPPNPSELLASDRMKHLIHEIRSKFAYVIFDSPPVMAVTDSIVLAASADGVVLCVHGGATPRDVVQRAAERLRQSNIPVLGALLNNLDLQQYGYSFKKNYYDYYDAENPSGDKAEKEPARKSG